MVALVATVAVLETRRMSSKAVSVAAAAAAAAAAASVAVAVARAAWVVQEAMADG